MKILLHTCCGTCAFYCIETLRKQGHSVDCFFYNPNIHPLAEYEKRKDSAKKTGDITKTNIYFHRDHKFEDYFRKITLHEDERCPLCWSLRLKHTAEFAKKGNYDAFSTTLLISPYQDHDKIKQISSEISSKYEIDFYYNDFRPGFRQSHQTAKQNQLYLQNYCGCIYSERDRHIRKNKLS